MSRVEWTTRSTLARGLALVGALMVVGAGCAVDTNEPGAGGGDDGDWEATAPLAEALDANGNLRLRAVSVTKTNSCIVQDTKDPTNAKLGLCENDASHQFLKPIGRKLNGQNMYQLRFATQSGGKDYCLQAVSIGSKDAFGLKALPCVSAPEKVTSQHFVLNFSLGQTKVCYGLAPTFCLHPTAAQNDLYLPRSVPANQSAPAWNWAVIPIPDADGDGVVDGKDRCLHAGNPGEVTADGCPDADHDGIPDSADKCPFAYGPKRANASTNGCPDTDGDGTIDRDDACPQQRGPANSSHGRGCPVCTDGSNGHEFHICHQWWNDSVHQYVHAFAAINACTESDAFNVARKRYPGLVGAYCQLGDPIVN